MGCFENSRAALTLVYSALYWCCLQEVSKPRLHSLTVLQDSQWFRNCLPIGMVIVFGLVFGLGLAFGFAFGFGLPCF